MCSSFFRRFCKAAREFPIVALAASSLGAAPQPAADYGRIPLHFEPNRGQTDPSVRFTARAAGVTLFLTDRESVMVLRGDKQSAVKMKLEGGRAPRSFTALERLEGVSNYYLGNDPRKWRAGVPHYGRVKAEGVYEGIDLVYYGRGRALEYDFVVAPHADPEQIRLSYKGTTGMRLDAAGDLILATRLGELRQKKPRVYQVAEGREVEVAAAYRITAEQEVAFEVGSYDPAAPLTIDPAVVYSTYLGGNQYDTAKGIAVDASGSAYVVGETQSPNFPTLNAVDSSFSSISSETDVFVTRLNPAGSGLVYSTYLGGTGSDFGFGIAVDRTNSAHVVGVTISSDFPTASALLSGLRGPGDGFVTKFSPTGSLVYSTYLGGSEFDDARAIAVDASSNAYVVGNTVSLDFPTQAAFRATKTGDPHTSNGFLTKLAPSGNVLVFSTYFGSGGTVRGVAVDSAGSAILGGTAWDGAIPVVAAAQSQAGSAFDGFVAKFAPSGASLVFSTYWGGIAPDDLRAVAVDSVGNIYVTGTTVSGFPVRGNPAQASPGGLVDGYVAKFTATGVPAYSTYLGGPGYDVGNFIAVDNLGRAVVVGRAENGFPTHAALRPEAAQSAFVTRLAADGSALSYSTYWGGRSDYGEGFGVAVDTLGNVYLAGIDTSGELPTQSGFQAAFGGVADAFVSKFTDGPPSISVTIGTSPSGLRYRVDGAEYTAPKTFQWLPGVTHSLDVVDQQPSSSDTSQYRFQAWSQGGAKSQTLITPAAATTYTANFALEPCTYSVSPTAGAVPFTGGSVRFDVATGLGCSWTARPNSAWITDGGRGTGPGSAAFGALSSPVPRSGTVTIAGQTLPFRQEAATSVVSPAEFQNFDVAGVIFSWTEMPIATGYDLRIETTSETPVTVFSGQLVGRTSVSTLISLVNGTYRFRVRHCNGGFADTQCGPWAERQFMVLLRFPTNAPPTVSSPAPNQNFTSSTQTFRWSAVQGASTYEVLLKNGATTELNITTPGTDTIFSMRGSTQYRLQVRACSASCGEWSAAVPFSVTLPPVPTAAPTVSSATLSGNQLAVTWSSVTNADLYVIQVVQPNTGPGGGALTVASVRTSLTSYTFSIPPGPAFVIVAACNGNGCGPYSPQTNISPTAAAPTAPVVGTPIGGTVVSGPNIVLTWSRVPGDNGSNTPYRLYVGDLSRNAPALDILTTTNFHGAFFRAEGSRYDALVFANPGTPGQQQGPATGFNVAGTNAASPTMTAPQHNSRVTQGNITLGWTPQLGAVLYQYYVGTPGSSSPTVTGVSTGLLVQVPLQAQNGQPTLYNGIVRACNAGASCTAQSDTGWGPWSNLAGPGITAFTVLP